jgi:hypothetical protein
MPYRISSFGRYTDSFAQGLAKYELRNASHMKRSHLA